MRIAIDSSVLIAAYILISVDRDLVDLKTIQGIPIVRPGDYWRRD